MGWDLSPRLLFRLFALLRERDLGALPRKREDERAKNEKTFFLC